MEETSNKWTHGQQTESNVLNFKKDIPYTAYNRERETKRKRKNDRGRKLAELSRHWHRSHGKKFWRKRKRANFLSFFWLLFTSSRLRLLLLLLLLDHRCGQIFRLVKKVLGDWFIGFFPLKMRILLCFCFVHNCFQWHEIIALSLSLSLFTTKRVALSFLNHTHT